MYNVGVAREILEKLDAAFPTKIHLHDIRAGSASYAELPNSDWLDAIQALRLKGEVNGKFLAEGTSIADAAALYITDRGRQELQKLVTVDDRPDIKVEKLQVFLCHSSGDKEAVRALYNKLIADGFKPWLDEMDILPGHDWNNEIRRAVRNSHAVVVCLSASSITKEGYVQKEIKLALDVAGEKPPDTIFLIPARLDECPVPERLSTWHWVDLYLSPGYERLVSALRQREVQRSRSMSPASKTEPPVAPKTEATVGANRPLQNVTTPGMNQPARPGVDHSRARGRFQPADDLNPREIELLWTATKEPQAMIVY